MDLAHLDYLRLVIEHGSFTAAARAAGRTQPAVSHAMRQLQQSFDVPLFTRAGRRLIPTPMAVQLASRSARLVREMQVIAAPRVLTGRRAMLRVGMTPSAALVGVSRLHEIWCADKPQRQLDIFSADEGVLLAQLQSGELDLVLAPLPRAWHVPDLMSTALSVLVPLVYARVSHPCARAQSLADLQQEAWVAVGPHVAGRVDVLREAFRVRRMKPPPVTVSCPDYACLARLLTDRDLLGVCPHPALLASANPGVLTPLALREALPRYEMHLFIRREDAKALSPVVDRLCGLWPRDV